MKPGPKPRPAELLTPAQLVARLRRVEQLEGLDSLAHVRLPAAPLMKLLRACDDLVNGSGGVRTAAACSPRYRRVIERAAERGYMSARLADEVCVKVLGLHPCEVFGDAWWTDDAKVPCFKG